MVPTGASFPDVLRRVAAFALDFIPLAILGWITTLALHESLVASYPWSRFAGLSAIALYRGTFQARYGQTPGQRLLGLRVADRHGRMPTFIQALMRNALVTMPMVLNNFSPSGVSRTSVPWQLFASLMVFGLGGGIVYMLLFNRGTRQGLHDLVCGTFVWRAADHVPTAHSGPLARIHLVILGLIAVACVTWTLLATRVLVERDDNAGLRPLLELREELLAQGRFRDVGVNYMTFQTSARTTRTLGVTLLGQFPKGDHEALFAHHDTCPCARWRTPTGGLHFRIPE
jgi:uncharacterized RDD family membrane protein YckC